MNNHTVKNVRYICDITGVGITSKWDVYGTDLGIPVYSPSQQRMYFLFGDTFGVPKGVTLEDNIHAMVDEFPRCNWRGTIAGYTTDFDLSNGINWDGFLDDENENARALIEAHYSNNDEDKEVTKICQGGIEIDGALYCFYESIRSWGPVSMGYERKWYVNYTGVIKSVDGGKTFERVHDLSWVETDRGKHAATVKQMAEEDMNHQPSGFDLDLSSHVAPGFGQVFALDGKDGYIYIYGRQGGRIDGIKVGRVKREKFEIFAEYEYLTGFENGAPIWVKGKDGLDVLMEKDKDCDIIQGPTSNMSVSYNHYLSKWLLTYYKPGVGIMYSLSDTCFGPFNEIKMMLPIDHPLLQENNPTGGNTLYGGFTHELLNQEQGKRVMMVISQWHEKFYNSKLVEVTFN